MSEPIPYPDRLVARLLALASALVALGCLARATGADGGTATLGWVLLASVALYCAWLGATYDTRLSVLGRGQR